MSRFPVSLCAVLLSTSPLWGEVVDFTFAVWSDTHFRDEGGGAYRDNSAGDIATIQGTPYPPAIGGSVGAIEFILVTGDITDHTDFHSYSDNDGQTNDDFLSHINYWFTMPVYEITGNHDSYNEPGATLIRQAITARHGGTSYCFDYHGVHFIGLDGWTGADGQEFHSSALDYLEDQMVTLTTEQAIVIFNHYTPPKEGVQNAQWNRLYNAIEGYNVLFLCHGHEHYPRTAQWRGFDYFVTSDCKLIHGNQAFSIVNITDTRLTVIAYDWNTNSWRTDALLQKPITGLGPWFSPNVVNPSFENNGGSLDGWQIIRADGKGPDNPPHHTGDYEVQAPDGQHFAGKITSWMGMDFTMGQIIEVADHDPASQLVVWNLSANVHLHCRNDGPPIQTFPQNVHQVWQVGWNNDGSVPATINHCDNYDTIADIDGYYTGNDPTYFYPLTASGGITGVTGLHYVAFRARFFNDQGKEWSMNDIDNVSFTAAVEPPGPQIELDPPIMQKSAWVGSNLDNDTFTVANVGPGTFNYTVSDDVDWLSVGPDAGSCATGESGLIHVTYAVADLPPGRHPATITVTSPEAWNSPKTLPVTVTVETATPDFDRDGDVDLDDFGHLQSCLTAPGVTQDNPPCLDARLDEDDDVDQTDLTILRNCLTGSRIPPAPNCAS